MSNRIKYSSLSIRLLWLMREWGFIEQNINSVVAVCIRFWAVYGLHRVKNVEGLSVVILHYIIFVNVC